MAEGSTTIRFTVPGVAQSRGSKRAFPIKRSNGSYGVAVSDNNPRSRDWMACVRAAALEAFKGDVLREPLIFIAKFYFPRPKGHFGSGRNAHVIKQSAPPVPMGRPDLLKLARGVEDALIGICYADDSLIVREFLAKDYGEPARAEIEIRKCEPQLSTNQQENVYAYLQNKAACASL